MQKKVKKNTKTVSKKSVGKKDNKNINNKKEILKKVLTKQNIIYFIILILDISILVYAARHNIINYTTLEGKTQYLGNKRNLFFGRNFITLLETFVVYLYFMLLNKFYFHKQLTKKYLVLSFVLLLFINCLVFYLFTIKVY